MRAFAAAAVIAVGIALLPYLPLPAPYAGRTVVPLTAEHLAELPTFPMRLDGFASVERTRLTNATWISGLSSIIGSETVVVNSDGGLTLFDRHGMMHTTSADRNSIASTRASIGLVGRPLGFAYDARRRLVICDSSAGLMRFDPKSGTMHVLANRLSDGTDLRFVNDVAIARDGAIYFSSASDAPLSWRHGPDALGARGFYDTMAAAKMNLVHGEATGRLLRYNPASASVEVLLDKVSFTLHSLRSAFPLISLHSHAADLLRQRRGALAGGRFCASMRVLWQPRAEGLASWAQGGRERRLSEPAAWVCAISFKCCCCC